MWSQSRSVAACLALTLCILCTGLAGAEENNGKHGVLLVAFGTSVESALASYSGIEAAFVASGQPVVWAFTSSIIREKMAQQGKTMYSLEQGMAAIANEGVTDLIVQSLHVMAGEEFTELERSLMADVLAHPGRFQSVKIGRPLLESMQDAEEVAAAVMAALPADRKQGDAVLLMAHGQSEGRCDLVFAGMQSVMQAGDPLVFMASVEGYQGIGNVLPLLKAQGVKRVWLMPLMVVAGNHAQDDLAGDAPDSWASLLKAQGMQVFPVLTGLGQQPGIQAVFVRHALESHDNILEPAA